MLICNSLPNKLDLSYKKMGVEGMKRFVDDSIKYTKVKTIDLFLNFIGDQGMKYFCEACKNFP